MIDVSIIIVSYDTKKMLRDCVRSIIAQTDECTYEITVIDNDSDDGSADAVQAEFKRVQVIRTGENCGFGRASNWAAKDAKGRRILLLNPDTIVIDKAIDRLNGFANQYPNAKIWGGRTFLEDGSLDQRCCRRHLNLWSLFCFYSDWLTHFQRTLFSIPSYMEAGRETVRVWSMSLLAVFIDRPGALGGAEWLRCDLFYVWGRNRSLSARDDTRCYANV
jgi:glycosyltransferase involved in cell wall biosynthesis